MRHFLFSIALFGFSFSFSFSAQETINGCTYPNADNFNNNATLDDGTCVFTNLYNDGYSEGVESVICP